MKPPHVFNTPQQIMPSSCNLIASCFVGSTSPNFLSFPHTTLLENIFSWFSPHHITRKHLLHPQTLYFLPFPFLSFFILFLFFFLFSHLAFIGHTCCNWHTRVPHCTYFGPISFPRDIGQPNCTTEPENGHCVQHNDLGLLSLIRQTYDISF